MSLQELVFGPTAKLSQEELNRRMRLIHERLAALEVFSPEWTQEVNLLRQVALDRINQALLPAYDAILGLAQLGVLFTTTSASDVAVGTGSKEFQIAEEKRMTFAPAANLGIRLDSAPEIAMFGRLVGYDRDTGVLVVDVTEAAGAGSHSGWTISASPPRAVDHERRTDNPHGVTKTQVGLGDVDNTSDMQKPVSIPQAEALSRKADSDAVALALGLKADATALAEKADKAAPFVTIASAATVNLGAAASPAVSVTGSTTITSFGASAPDGAEYIVKFSGALTVTHSATLILPEGTNLTTYANMMMIVRKEPSNVWRVIWYSSRLDISGGGANRIKFDAGSLSATRTITLPNANVDLSVIPTLPFTRAPYDSGEQAITSGGLLNLSHPLGVIPKFYTIGLVCKVAEFGFSVGDIIWMPLGMASTTAADRGISLLATDTLISFMYGTATAVFAVHNRSTRVSVALTNASWRMILRAYA